MHLSRDNFHYAMDTTRVLREPDRRIATFGETRLTFQLLTEPMDSVGTTRLRTGDMEAAKPLLIKPSCDMEFGGFHSETHEKLHALLSDMRQRGIDLAFLQYGFRFRRSHVTEQLIPEPIEDVSQRLLEDVRRTGDPMLAIITGIDDSWEISLMKFAIEMIVQSHSINTFDLQRKKLL